MTSDADTPNATEYYTMLANLTSVQARCTELLEENRKLRDQLHQLHSAISRTAAGSRIPGEAGTP